MKFFNRFSKNSEASNNSPEAPNKWEDVASNNNFEAQAQLGAEAANSEVERIADQERQERKIIDALLRGSNAFTRPDANITDQDRSIVYQALANGTVDTDHKSRLLQDLATPFHRSPDSAISSLNTKQERRILASFSGTGFDFWESTSAHDLQNILNRYPTPYELAADEKDLLEDIREHNPPEKYSQYQEAMENFKQKVYGKRYEYYNALESLQQKADKQAATDAYRTEVLNSYANTTSNKPEATSKSIEIQRLTPEKQQEILKNSKINGENFIYNGYSYQLTPDILEQFGLAPNYSFQLENTKINLSDPYQVDGHSAVTAYVETDKGINVCSYYRSNSQGLWRLLPDYVSNPNNPNNTITWFGKGYDEESLNLPSETQYALETIVDQQPNVQLDPINAEFAFAGTANRYNSKDEYRQYLDQHALRGSHYREVNSTPSFSLGHVDFQKSPPESLNLTGPSAPDFQRSKNPYTTNTGLYGQISVEHIPSDDNALQYTFSRDSQNRAWLSGIEVKSANISSSGLRTAWATAGDYGTPIYEYQQMSDGYGDQQDTRGHYVNMWTNYVSRIPLIQRYLTARKS